MSSLKARDFYDLRFLGNINSAKDRIFFEIFKPVEKENNYESGIFELRGGKISRYTRGSADRDSVPDHSGRLIA